jgi:S-adenosylmethionine:tRNA ribosyltransferase-isomerase
MREINPEHWDALVHPGQKLGVGEKILFEGNGRQLFGEVVSRSAFGRRVVRLWSDQGDPWEAIESIGHIPLPPYIKRPDDQRDRDRYQTVYARTRGSVAAPTAGLHFTAELFESLASRNVIRTELTLHVGYGTFKPLRTDRVEDHVIDAESFEISEETAHVINRALDENRRVIAVGTTTTRALETSVRHGGGRIVPGKGVSDLFIYPGFSFSAVSGIMTNFHLPKSSLLMLVSAFAGRDCLLAAYDEAVRMNYRFYSYGDAMLIV